MPRCASWMVQSIPQPDDATVQYLAAHQFDATDAGMLTVLLACRVDETRRSDE